MTGLMGTAEASDESSADRAAQPSLRASATSARPAPASAEKRERPATATPSGMESETVATRHQAAKNASARALHAKDASDHGRCVVSTGIGATSGDSGGRSRARFVAPAKSVVLFLPNVLRMRCGHGRSIMRSLHNTAPAPSTRCNCWACGPGIMEVRCPVFSGHSTRAWPVHALVIAPRVTSRADHDASGSGHLADECRSRWGLAPRRYRRRPRWNPRCLP